tara:strand:+ start:103 stop:831 length:729 start_codon:yes stop_codon:yes gene_type:complete
MARYFDDPDYNPRRGAGNTGRVRKEDFSIDGKSWDYRDPYNQREIDRENIGREKSNVTINPNNYAIANPLYDYDYGRVRDAAKELGIGNVNEQSEVDDILNYIRTGQGKKKDDEENKYEYKPTPLPEDPYGRGGDDRLIGRPFPGRPGSGGDKGNVPGSIQYNPPSDNSELGRAISSVADYGNRGTDDYFGRFLPEMGQRNVNEAKATGRSLLSNIQKFQGKVPELGDPKDLFEYYLGKLKD